MVSRAMRRASCAAALAVLAAGALLGHPREAAGQAGTSPTPFAPSRAEQPPRAAPPASPPPAGPAAAAEAPVPSDANLGPPAPVSPLPAAGAPSGLGQPYGATDLSAPVMAAPAAEQPFYQKWWFWTAVGAFAVTAVVIVLASSDSGPPSTHLGNMPAF